MPPQFFIVLTAVVASLLEIIDTSIVNVAIPTMMGNLGATLEDISWVVTGYIISNAVVLPIAAWLGMRIGRKVYYTGCILSFTAASVACGLAPNLEALIFFRVIQGAAGGALLPTSQALISEVFSGERAGVGSAIYGMSVMIGPTLGPTLGGYLTDQFGWRSIFNINLPVGVLASFLSWIYVKDSKVMEHPDQTHPKKSKIDLIGLVLLIVGIGSLQLVLERGQADDWFESNTIIFFSMLAVFGLVALIVWELSIPNPIVDLRLFKFAIVRYGTMLMAQLGAIFYAITFLIPIFATQLLHFDATQTGKLFIRGSLVSAACMPFIGMQLRKSDPRKIILVGVIGLSVALLWLASLTSQTSVDDLFWPLLIRGAASGFLFVPINSMILGQFSGAQVGQVAGLLNLLRQIGGSVAIAVLSTLLTRKNAEYFLELTSKMSLLAPETWKAYQSALGISSGSMSENLGFSTAVTTAIKTLRGRIQQEVFILSFNRAMFYAFLIWICSLIPLSRLKGLKKVTTPSDAH